MRYGETTKADTGLDGTGIEPDYNIPDYTFETRWTYCHRENTYSVRCKEPDPSCIEIEAGAQVDVSQYTEKFVYRV